MIFLDIYYKNIEIKKMNTYGELKNLQEQYRNKENYMKLMCEYEGKFHIRSDF